jgi:hypothetical protein
MIPPQASRTGFSQAETVPQAVRLDNAPGPFFIKRQTGFSRFLMQFLPGFRQNHKAIRLLTPLVFLDKVKTTRRYKPVIRSVPMSTSKDELSAVIARRKREMESLRAALKEQDCALEKLREDFAALGIADEALPSLDDLSPEQREQYLAFERELREIDGLLAQRRPKPKTPTQSRRVLV